MKRDDDYYIAEIPTPPPPTSSRNDVGKGSGEGGVRSVDRPAPPPPSSSRSPPPPRSLSLPTFLDELSEGEVRYTAASESRRRSSLQRVESDGIGGDGEGDGKDGATDEGAAVPAVSSSFSSRWRGLRAMGESPSNEFRVPPDGNEEKKLEQETKTASRRRSLDEYDPSGTGRLPHRRFSSTLPRRPAPQSSLLSSSSSSSRRFSYNAPDRRDASSSRRYDADTPWGGDGGAIRGGGEEEGAEEAAEEDFRDALSQLGILDAAASSTKNSTGARGLEGSASAASRGRILDLDDSFVHYDEKDGGRRAASGMGDYPSGRDLRRAAFGAGEYPPRRESVISRSSLSSSSPAEETPAMAKSREIKDYGDGRERRQRRALPGSKLLRNLVPTFAPRRSRGDDEHNKGRRYSNRTAITSRRDSSADSISESSLDGSSSAAMRDTCCLSKNSWWRLTALRIAAVLLSAVLTVGAVSFLKADTGGSLQDSGINDGGIGFGIGNDSSSPLGTLEYTGQTNHGPNHPNHHKARLEALTARIVESGASPPEALLVPPPEDDSGAAITDTNAGANNDARSDEMTPQRRALLWLAFSDPRRLDVDDPYLIQRYGLAVFWFATAPTTQQQQLQPAAPAHRRDGDGRLGIGDEGKEEEGEDGRNEAHGQELKWSAPTRSGGGGGRESSHQQLAASAAPADFSSAAAAVPSLASSSLLSSSSSSWKTSTNWMSGRGICSWHGVRCSKKPRSSLRIPTGGDDEEEDEVVYHNDDDDGDVTKLILRDNGLSGGERSLPGEVFAALPALTELDLAGNALRGTLPDEALLRASSKLERLVLAGNELSGSLLPSSSSSSSSFDEKSSSLIELDLSDNLFSGTIPGKVLSELLGGTTTLRTLSLRGNDFTGSVPWSSLATLSRLEILDLDSNKLRGTLPSDLTKLFGEEGGLTSLKVLRATDNALTGSIPSDLFDGEGGMVHLEELRLDMNRLKGPLPESISRLSRLETLHLGNNGGLGGTLPSSWSNLRSLRHLSLDGNALTGTIPERWCSGMAALADLDLSFNALGGTFPSRLSLLNRTLASLRLDDNDFAGTVPWNDLGTLSVLEVLTLDGNPGLIGTVPGEMCELLRAGREGGGSGAKLRVLTVPCEGGPGPGPEEEGVEREEDVPPFGGVRCSCCDCGPSS